MSSQPLIGVTACTRQIGLHPFHIAGDKYLRAVAVGAGGLPLVIPALAELIDTPSLLAGLDGLLLTGSPSNVEPHHYQGPDSAPGTRSRPGARPPDPQPDPRRGGRRGAAAGHLPRLPGNERGVRRQPVPEGPQAGPFMDHREDPDSPLEVQYGLRHPVMVQPGGLFERLGLPASFAVNSVHGQGVERLAPGLRVEALAPDGLVGGLLGGGRGRFRRRRAVPPEWRVRRSIPPT